RRHWRPGARGPAVHVVRHRSTRTAGRPTERRLVGYARSNPDPRLRQSRGNARRVWSEGVAIAARYRDALAEVYRCCLAGNGATTRAGERRELPVRRQRTELLVSVRTIEEWSVRVSVR